MPFEITRGTTTGEVYTAVRRGWITADEVATVCTRREGNAMLERGVLERPPPTSDEFAGFVVQVAEHRKRTPEGWSQWKIWWEGNERQVGIHDHFHHGMRVIRDLHHSVDPELAELDREMAKALWEICDTSVVDFRILPQRIWVPHYSQALHLDGRSIRSKNIIEAWDLFSQGAIRRL